LQAGGHRFDPVHLHQVGGRKPDDGGRSRIVVGPQSSVPLLETRQEDVIREALESVLAGLLIERVKRRVVRDRGGRPLVRVLGYARYLAVGLPEVSSGEEVAVSGEKRRPVSEIGYLIPDT
jgi:hypothetical protein